METVWLSPALSDEIIQNEEIFKETQNIVTDIMCRRLDIPHFIEYLAGVLTHKDADIRAKGVSFLTKVLKELPYDYLKETEIKFISKFYTDRLKDNHKVIPPLLEGYLVLVGMAHYRPEFCAHFFVELFQQVACQSQVREDRYNIFLIIQKLVDKDAEYMKTLGPDFIYGVISAIDGERDPRNLLFLFNFLPKFLSTIPLFHLTDEMFEVVSCYFPIEFTPSPSDPAGVTRSDLATALGPCLCATQLFAQQCLPLLIEKLDSSLRFAKIDSLKLLEESCKVFKAESYEAFLKALWSSLLREMSHKSDEELKLLAHQALAALVCNLSTADKPDIFKTFIKGVLIATQTQMAAATTVTQFVEAKRIVLTTANACLESCVLVCEAMIPATVAYFGFNTSEKLQVASLVFAGELLEVGGAVAGAGARGGAGGELPQLCLAAASAHNNKELQLAALNTLARCRHALDSDLALPYIDILMYNLQHSLDNDLLAASVNTVHMLAQMFPEIILERVIRGTCDIDNLTDNTSHIQKRLMLLCNLASIDNFTKYIIEKMLLAIRDEDRDNVFKVLDCLNESISNSSLYSCEKITEIESDHGLLDAVIARVYQELPTCPDLECLNNSFSLISTTIGSLPSQKQLNVLHKHSAKALEKAKGDELHFLILECLYISLRQDVYDSSLEEVVRVSMYLSLRSERAYVRERACVLLAHVLNKAEGGSRLDALYALVTGGVAREGGGGGGGGAPLPPADLTPRLLTLYAWIAHALLLRASELFMFWLQKISVSLWSPEHCFSGAAAVRVVAGVGGGGGGAGGAGGLSARRHCRVSLLRAQRLWAALRALWAGGCGGGRAGDAPPAPAAAWLQAWAHVMPTLPTAVLTSDADEIGSLCVGVLSLRAGEVVGAGLGVAGAGLGVAGAGLGVVRRLVRARPAVLVGQLPALLPALLQHTTYTGDMEVRISALECLFEIAAQLPSPALLLMKEDVLSGLAPALDDGKRRVRAAAVRARTRWYLLGADGDPDHH